MALLHVENLSKSFGERTVFSGVTFEVANKDHIGLMGVNGCGKSTLFRLLSGQDHPDSGTVSTGKLTKISLLDQSPVFSDSVTLYEAVLQVFSDLLEKEKQLSLLSRRMESDGVTDAMVLRQAQLQESFQSGGGLTCRARTRSTLLGLGFTEEELSQPIKSMSGGQMRKAELAKILLSEADLLLLDEPTNHLDIASLEWLEGYLKEFRGAFIVISHDRYFLDQVCTRMLDMEHGCVSGFSGNYTEYIEHKMDQREYAMRRYENGLREIKRIEGIIQQQRRWNQERNYVTIASKIKQIDRLKAQLIKPEKEPDAMHFSLHAQELTANEVVVCRNLQKAFGTKTLFSNLNLLIQNGERVCLLGENGCGKTTLMRILMGLEAADGGFYKLGPDVSVGYFSQSTLHTDETAAVLDSMLNAYPRFDTKPMRNLLGQFLFRGDDVFKPMNLLSGGELARIQLLKLMLKGSNVLFLDEPTNHLDIPSREALEKALAQYGGTMLIITHDRYFANRIADRMVLMDGEGLHDFEGDWDSYTTARAEKALLQAPLPQEESLKNEYLINKERRAALAKAKAALAAEEKTVAALEAEIAALNEKALAPEAASDYSATQSLYEEMEQLNHALDQAYASWERAQAQLDALAEEEA
jgi:ATP-binding cassette subfamily F protein 3